MCILAISKLPTVFTDRFSFQKHFACWVFFTVRYILPTRHSYMYPTLLVETWVMNAKTILLVCWVAFNFELNFFPAQQRRLIRRIAKREILILLPIKQQYAMSWKRQNATKELSQPLASQEEISFHRVKAILLAHWVFFSWQDKERSCEVNSHSFNNNIQKISSERSI